MRESAPLGLSVVTLCAVCALPVTAGAVTRAEVTAVVEAYVELRFDEARKAADDLLNSDANGPEDLAALYRVRGEIAAATGELKKAQWALERLLALDPAATPSPDSSPKIMEVYEAARARWREFTPFAITHETPRDLDAGELVLTFKLDSDPLDLVKKIVVHYQLPGTSDFKVAEGSGLDEVEIRIPVAAAGSKAVAYYATAVNERGSAWKRWGDAGSPLVVPKSGSGFVPIAPPDPGGKGTKPPPGSKTGTKGGLSTAAAVAIVIGGVMVASVVAALLVATTR